MALVNHIGDAVESLCHPTAKLCGLGARYLSRSQRGIGFLVCRCRRVRRYRGGLYGAAGDVCGDASGLVRGTGGICGVLRHGRGDDGF